MTDKYKIGDKVVPINKTAYCDLNDSVVWRRSEERGFMYVVRIEREHYVCAEEEEVSGDYFNESDLIPFVELKRTGTIVELYNLMESDEIAVIKDTPSLSVYKDALGNLKWVDDDTVVKFNSTTMNTEFKLVKAIRNYIPMASVYFTIDTVFYAQGEKVSKLSFDKAFTVEELSKTRFFYMSFED